VAAAAMAVAVVVVVVVEEEEKEEHYCKAFVTNVTEMPAVNCTVQNQTIHSLYSEVRFY
jgi:hypothetical protein